MDTFVPIHVYSVVWLPVHEHPLFHTAKFNVSVCAWCHLEGIMYSSYVCDEVSCRLFHKMVSRRFRLHKSVEAPLEINHHPCHPEHPSCSLMTLQRKMVHVILWTKAFVPILYMPHM
uniref:Uncharacterized protein n=1 Tax=Brassica oleracea TaxID=3712 RepID=A0A3P6B8Y6_BRAOL|nr:unnamed protein product [Brassica oleracea]